MEKKVIIIFMIPFFLFWHWFEPAAKKNLAGIEAYQSRKYDEALEQFLSAKGVKPDMAELKSNTAAALYQMKKYKEALEEFSKIDPKKTDISKADFYYNLGNSFFRLNQFDKALDGYKKSLIERPDDINTKKNYELTLKKLQEQKKKQQQKKQDKNKEKDKEKQKQQQQQQQQKKDKKHRNLMQYLDQKEKKQMKKKKRKIGIARKEKDW